MSLKFSPVQSFLWGAITVHFALTARVGGTFAEADLRQALAAIRRRYPQLGASVSYDDGSLPSFEIDEPVDIPLRIVQREGDEGWNREAAYELGHQFPAHGPLARVVWLRGAETSDVILIFHHALGDGLSALYVMRDLLAALGEPERALDPLPPAAAVIERLPPAIIDALKQIPLPQFIAEPPDIPADAPLPMKKERDDLHVIAWQLGRDDTRAVVERSHAEGVTVHGALCAALMLAYVERQPGALRRLQSPMSVRRQIEPPGGEELGLFITLLEMDVKCDADRSLWAIARDITAYFHEASAGPAAFALGWILDAAFRVMPYPTLLRLLGGNTSVNYDFSVSNLGRLTIPLIYGALRLEALYGPAVIGPDEEKVISAATLDDQLFFTLTFNPNFTLTVDEARAFHIRAMTLLLDSVRSDNPPESLTP